MNKARAELMERPSSEETVAQYDAMFTEVRAAIVVVFPLLRWKAAGEGNDSGCSKPFDHLNGETHFLSRWYIEGGISASDWPRAVTVVSDIVTKYGFSGAAALADSSANRQVTFPDAYGGHLDFGSGVNAVMSVTTACHLPNSERTPPSS